MSNLPDFIAIRDKFAEAKKHGGKLQFDEWHTPKEGFFKAVYTYRYKVTPNGFEVVEKQEA